jgi:hypothetical protein
MLRWMCGDIRWDKIRNGNIVGIVGVAPIVKKLWKIGLGSLDMYRENL